MKTKLRPGLALAALLLLASAACGGEAAKPAAATDNSQTPQPQLGQKGAPAPATQGAWDAKLFDYVRPQTLVVEETTPTAAQAGFWLRPPQAPADAPQPKATGPAKPLAVGAMNVVHLRFRDALGDVVPAILCTPKDKAGPFPLVVAVHGLTSHKAQMVGLVGGALAARGFAILATDLPCHGERPGVPMGILDPQRSFENYRKAVIDVRQLLDLAEARPEIDHKTGVALMGYSLGSWVSSIAGPADPRVKALVLMVGPGLFGTGDGPTGGEVAAISPRLSIQHFAGRPILQLCGKSDPLVSPENCRRFFEAAPEPKKQLWYECGHLLPKEAHEEAARWLAETLHVAERPAPDKPPAQPPQQSP
jgi:alpha-beta hydrolase superfamily lysophospholipase